MSTHVKDIIVIAVDQADYDAWLIEYPELETADVHPVFAKTWEDLAPSRLGFFATTYVYTERALNRTSLPATEAPRWIKIAEAFAERRRPKYLRDAA